MDVYDHALNIAATLGKELLQSGASLERANLTMLEILHAYGLQDISLHCLSTNLVISGVDKDGESHIKQARVLPADVNLERLRQLNALARRVHQQTPEPSVVYEEIREILGQKPLPWYYILGGFLIAMACLCRMFGGTWQEIVIAMGNTTLLYFMTLGMGRLHLNKILINFIAGFAVTSTSLFFAYIGFIANCYTVIITNAFFLINGIGMVNAIRNLLCGNEMNGILEFFKVCLELLVTVAGVAASFFFFGNWYNVMVEDAIVVSKGDFLANAELVGLSFLASIGFAMVFKTQDWRDLLLAGIGGILVRIVYLLLLWGIPEYRVVYASIAAFTAAVYAAIMAKVRRRSSTYYLYPSIVPLIPGDLIYYAALGIVWRKMEMFGTNSAALLLQLVGMSVGFVVCSTAVYLVRRLQLGKMLRHFIHKGAEETKSDVDYGEEE